MFPPAELATLQHSIATMVAALDNTCHQLSDSPDHTLPDVVVKTSTSHRGRPKIHIDPSIL